MSDFIGTTFATGYPNDYTSGDNPFPSNFQIPQTGPSHLRPGLSAYPNTIGTAHMHQIDGFLGGNGDGSNEAATATLMADTLVGTVPVGDINKIVAYTSLTHSRMQFISPDSLEINIGMPNAWVYHAPTPFDIPSPQSSNFNGIEASANDWLYAISMVTVLGATVALAPPGTQGQVATAILAVAEGVGGFTGNRDAFAHIAHDIAFGVTNYQKAVDQGMIGPIGAP